MNLFEQQGMRDIGKLEKSTILFFDRWISSLRGYRSCRESGGEMGFCFSVDRFVLMGGYGSIEIVEREREKNRYFFLFNSILFAHSKLN